eukprot:4051461-Pyramimonas_sp.AAC.3
MARRRCGSCTRACTRASAIAAAGTESVENQSTGTSGGSPVRPTARTSVYAPPAHAAPNSPTAAATACDSTGSTRTFNPWALGYPGSVLGYPDLVLGYPGTVLGYPGSYTACSGPRPELP